MSQPSKQSSSETTGAAVARLVRQLQETEARLRELLGERTDTVTTSDGQTFLLKPAQEKLIQRGEEARRNEVMLNHAQRIAQFGCWELDLTNLETVDDNPLRWSDEVFRIFGYQPGEIVVSNENFFRSVHPDDHARIKNAIGEAIRTGKDYDIDHRIILPDGTIRHVHEEGRVFRDAASDRPLKIIGVVQDISEWKRKEEELRLSEDRFASAFEHASIGMALVAPDGRWLKVNLAVCGLVGYAPEELYAKTFQDITHPDDLQADLTHVRELLADEIQHYQMEKRYFHKLGHIVRVQLSVSLVRDSLGRPLYFISQIQDITEQKAAAQKLAEQAALIDQARDAIIQRDLNHTILFWNKGAERLYGWTEHEVIGRKATDLGYRTNSEKLNELNRIVLAQGEWSGELEHNTKDGLIVTVESRWTLLRDDNGQPKSILSINSDITERKKMESQLLRAQRIESIGTLAGGIAHDLNNLLAPIVMGVELLKHFGLSGQSLEVVNNIERSAKRGASLVKQVLSFARGEEGARLAVHIGDVLNEIESMFHNTFPKNITLETKIAPDLWLLTGDPTQINQVLLNLCVNARDAMPNGGKLSISAGNTVLDAQLAATRPQAVAGRYVLVEVSDTGCGIPREIIDKIFDPFFTTKELSKGTGLGLSTCLGIIRSHGGFMSVYSELGKGSAFKIYLPARMDELPAAIDPCLDEDWPRGRAECILLVDDEESILTVTQQTLEAFGYRVLTAADGAQAVSVFALNRDKITLVLTDMMMPVMDGPATIVALRQIDPRIKIIAASGLNPHGDGAQASHAGVKHFLSKPYTTKSLLVILRDVLQERN
jgi:PAS domain S-box-containing protein